MSQPVTLNTSSSTVHVCSLTSWTISCIPFPPYCKGIALCIHTTFSSKRWPELHERLEFMFWEWNFPVRSGENGHRFWNADKRSSKQSHGTWKHVVTSLCWDLRLESQATSNICTQCLSDWVRLPEKCLVQLLFLKKTFPGCCSSLRETSIQKEPPNFSDTNHCHCRV